MPWMPELTEHEVVVLRLLARGRTYREIAEVLKVRPEVAGKLVSRMQIMLRAKTVAHAVAIGYETGILAPKRDGAGGG